MKLRADEILNFWKEVQDLEFCDDKEEEVHLLMSDCSVRCLTCLPAQALLILSMAEKSAEELKLIAGPPIHPGFESAVLILAFREYLIELVDERSEQTFNVVSDVDVDEVCRQVQQAVGMGRHAHTKRMAMRKETG